MSFGKITVVGSSLGLAICLVTGPWTNNGDFYGFHFAKQGLNAIKK